MKTRAVLAFALVAAAAGCDGTRPGRRAPSFTLPDLDGKSVSLADFRGRTVLLCFWGGWAPPCRLELGDLARLRRTRPQEALAVLAVAVDEDAGQAARDVKGLRPGFPVLVADDATTAKYFRRGDLSVPLILLLDAKGIVVQRWLGYRSQADLEALVDRALGS